ncbi:efflux transporter outer membrane subunit [Massilia sp. NEAU-DD11]|uniref:Efflux transporter outer membrane subunit n=2 Tax=Massilia cellulosiltytica TaxID=2683234 RepID=A0A7X3G343_9BURK|nr:efflux transporter outer membrane subunit [Telluria cellulosilytica]
MNRPMPIATTIRPLISALLAAAVLSGCALAPTYERPATPQPAAFKELHGWAPAAPADALDRGPWWTLFNDPVLDGLVGQVEVSNQNVAAAVAAYSQARALVAQQRAALFPTVTLTGGANRNGNGGGNDNNNGRTSNSFRLNIGSSWEPDVWGRLRAGISAAQANAQASAADLASARLSAQGELAADYFSLRSVDAQRALLATTIEGYQRVLKITQNRFDVGIVPHSDVYQAQTQLASAQSDDLTLARQRAQLEHAIAVLVGKAPADFALAPAPWTVTVPDVPVGVPSTLLERRPDIAASERAVAAANAQIGLVRAAYFPQIGLTASYGPSASAIGDLFKASSMAWALGLSATETIFNGGANRAAVQGADAAREQAVARYRQTVLDAFADVEDQLNATRVLAQQQELQRQASAAADKVEEQVLNRYKAGQVSYSEVVQAQVTALNARRALVQTQGNRQTTAVALIQSLGGGWHADQLTAQE